jgi:hypothetical protein
MAKRKADRLAEKGVKYPGTRVKQATAADDKKPKRKAQKGVSSEKWSDEYLKEYILRCKKEAEDASRERRSAWKELWLLYQNKQDTKKKKSWQSKCFVPKIWMKVERAASTVKRGLMQTNKLFKLELDDTEELEEPQVEKLEAEMKKVEKKFKRKLGETNYANIYSEMTKCLFLLGLGVPKVLWGKNGATYENVDILNLHVDPGYKPFQEGPPKYIIEFKEMDLAELRSLAKETNEAAGESIFDTAAINKIEEDFKEHDKQSMRQQRQGLGQYIPASKRVTILEFWGDVIDKEGYDVKKNQVMMLANNKYIIRNQDNPFIHKLPPYILTFAMVYPHRGIAGHSLVEPSAKLQYTYNNILNLYMDNLNFSVNKMFQYNPLGLRNPKEILSIFPGKTFETQSNEPAVHEVMTSNVGPESIAALETVGREIQEATAVTEFLMGMPSRKAKTKGEVEIKTAESQGLFDVIARDLEQNSVKPLLEMTYSLYVQFGGMPDIEGLFIFKVGGLSLMIMQKEQTERVGQILSAALSQPELRQRTDIDDLWRKLLSIYNLSDVYIEPERQEQQLPPEQIKFIEAQAEKDAKKKVAGMQPQEIMKLAG